MNLLSRAKRLSEAKTDYAIIISKVLEAVRGRSLVEKMLEERLENELLVF
jgi:hypothetical protein